MTQNPQPLVSCIMPTNNRREFVPQAIQYFLQQDYQNKELLIVDDGTDPIADLVPKRKQIRYIRLGQKYTLGAKRNYCVLKSKGELIMHWDDDDWMAPHRISYQVQALLANNAEVCGLQQMLFYDVGTNKSWLYKYPKTAQPWLAGGSLLYTKEFWKKSPFPDMQVASDTKFILSRKLASYIALADHTFYVATIHDKNTSPKLTDGNVWQDFETEKIKNIISNDWPFYLAFNKKEHEQKYSIDNNTITASEPLDNNLVTACLLSYRRPENIQKIIDSIHNYSFIDEIIVWNNNTDCELILKADKIRVINSPENMICYGRFLCAAHAKNKTVYFQDDDAIINNIAELHNEFLKDNSRISYGLSTYHYPVRDKYIYSSGQVAFLGWGSFIKKSWLSVLNNYLEENDRDYIFLREADKFFTLLLKKQHNPILANIQLLEGNNTSGVALYLEKDHTYCVAMAIKKALEFSRKSQTLTYPVTWNIVITCKDYGQYIEEAVSSVLYNHADYIITIVDDASSDNTSAVCLQLVQKYPFIKYLRNEQNMGTGFSRNYGIASTESIFVVLLDADDKIGPEYLFEAEKLLRKGYDVINPDAILFGDTISRWPVPETVSLAMQLNKNHVHCCSAFRRTYWAEVGGIDENMQCWEDYEFWIRLAEAGARIKKLSGNHFHYRQHSMSKTVEANLNVQDPKSYIRTKHKKLFEVYGAA